MHNNLSFHVTRMLEDIQMCSSKGFYLVTLNWVSLPISMLLLDFLDVFPRDGIGKT